MADYEEEQANEIEALESIYPDELQGTVEWGTGHWCREARRPWLDLLSLGSCPLSLDLGPGLGLGE